MSTNRITSLLCVTGASLLLSVGAVAAAAPSSAASVGVDALPANVKVTQGDIVSVAVKDSPVCAVGTTGFLAFIGGRQDAVTLAVPNVPNSAVCNGATLNATVTPTTSNKRNAVVKFTATVTATGEKVVQTLVVHVDKGKRGNSGHQN